MCVCVRACVRVCACVCTGAGSLWSSSHPLSWECCGRHSVELWVVWHVWLCMHTLDRCACGGVIFTSNTVRNGTEVHRQWWEIFTWRTLMLMRLLLFTSGSAYDHFYLLNSLGESSSQKSYGRGAVHYVPFHHHFHSLTFPYMVFFPLYPLIHLFSSFSSLFTSHPTNCTIPSLSPFLFSYSFLFSHTLLQNVPM